MDQNNIKNIFHCPHCNKVTFYILDVCPHCHNLIHASPEENKKYRNMLLIQRVLGFAVIISLVAAFISYSVFSPLKHDKTKMREINYKVLTEDTEYNEHAYTDVALALEYATLESYIKSGYTTIPSYNSDATTKVYYIALCNGDAESIDDIVLEIPKSDKDELDAQLQAHMAEGKPCRLYGTVVKGPENASTLPTASSILKDLDGTANPDNITMNYSEQREQNEEALEYLNSHKILSVDIHPQFEEVVVVGKYLTPGAYFVYAMIGLAIAFFFLRKYVKKRYSKFMASIAYIH